MYSLVIIGLLVILIGVVSSRKFRSIVGNFYDFAIRYIPIIGGWLLIILAGIGVLSLLKFLWTDVVRPFIMFIGKKYLLGEDFVTFNGMDKGIVDSSLILVVIIFLIMAILAYVALIHPLIKRILKIRSKPVESRNSGPHNETQTHNQ